MSTVRRFWDALLWPTQRRRLIERHQLRELLREAADELDQYAAEAAIDDRAALSEALLELVHHINAALEGNR